MGTADAGKTTLIRHMRQLNGEQFDKTELQQFKVEIKSACLKHFQDIVSYLIKKEILHSSDQEECKRFVEEFQEIHKHENLVKDKVEIWQERVMSIWNISLVNNYILNITKGLDTSLGRQRASYDKVILEKSSGITARKLHSDNPANHFLQSFCRIISQDYKPTLEDILNLRLPTSGMILFHR